VQEHPHGKTEEKVTQPGKLVLLVMVALVATGVRGGWRKARKTEGRRWEN